VALIFLVAVPVCAALAAGTALPPVTDADGRLGFDDVLAGAAPSGPSWAQLAYDAGARVNRWEFRWDRLEAQPGQWNFAPDDADVSASHAAGLQVEGIVDGIPRWATAPGQPPGNGVARGLGYPVTNRRNLWASFVRAMVAHYRGRVAYWEIWNEPDLKFFWNGTPGDYYRTLQVAYRVIRQTDPAAEVLMAGMVAPNLAFVRQVLDAARHDARHRIHAPFDLAAWHAYGPARSLYINLVRFKRLLARHGFGSTEVWVTEDGFPASNPAGEPRQAAYILETIAYALAAGAGKVLIYRASDDQTPKQWGVLDTSGSPRMGYTAFQLAAEYLSGIHALVHAPTATLERFAFYGQNRRVTLVWDRAMTDQPFLFPAGQDAASTVDWTGTAAVSAAPDGFFHLTAPGASYNASIDPRSKIVGGPPLFIVEGDSPASGLNENSYVMPVKGMRRTLVLVNPGDSGLRMEVAARNNPNMRQTVSLGPHAMRTVDLDLLAGPAYGGMYSLTASGPVEAVATSSSATFGDVTPAIDWYVPAVPATVLLSNPSPQSVKVRFKAYADTGRLLHTWTLTAAAGASVRWSRTAVSAAGRVSLVVHAGGPIIPLAGTDRLVPSVQTTWYLLHPHGSHLVLFNPGTAPAQIDVHFAGSSNVQGEQLVLGAKRSFGLSTHAASAIVLTADQPVAVAPGTNTSVLSPGESGPTNQTALALAGTATHVVIYNPSAQPAHVAVSILGGTGAVVSKTAAPGQVVSLRLRAAGDPPLGALMQSDVAVIAASGS
jgi:hypothetical protein